MMLINRARAIAAACVVQVAPDGALEEALAALAGKLAVVLARRLVAADHAFDVRFVTG